MVHNNTALPNLFNGVYTFFGSEMSFRAHADTPTKPIIPQPQQPNVLMIPTSNTLDVPNNNSFQEITPPIEEVNLSTQQINIMLVGNKTKSSNPMCIFSTICFGMCCIFPLCFMCCNWWKKAVYPIYELSLQAYREVASFLERNPTANNLNLIVVDNAFNYEKASVLYDTLSRGQIRTISFTNKALACNGELNELDSFRNNMLPIKSLGIESSLIWGDTIV